MRRRASGRRLRFVVRQAEIARHRATDVIVATIHPGLGKVDTLGVWKNDVG
ncbi:MAG TPA: hypothetical protein VJO99_26300 [Burkholderiaceae bacterium]|nr:hypothetical protein [Burkholderiaceae bacterium]